MSKWTTGPQQPVAVVGMSCRVPGAATPDELWTLLCDEVDATGETPPDRYDVDAVYSEEPAPGKLVSRRAGYLTDMTAFDAKFFGMSTSEAAELDPQQRLLMMTAWEALEDAGQPPDQLAGSRTGVFVGNGRADFLESVFRQGLDAVTAGQFNNVRSVIPARLSHYFDLRGPSMLVDTACSSSLVAVHQAVLSLRAGECPFALAAGVNLTLRPDEGVLMSQVGTLSADGRSKFGDAAADGHAPSDAVVVVALKPLAAAVADGDRIRAVIAGSAVGNDGHTSDTILNPSLEGQLDILRWAYEDAGVKPSEVDFIEAHGSGSPQLDPLELTALAQVLGEGRSPDRRLLVGSVKSNVGHAEAAGGLVGLVKTVLSLEHAQVPASLHADTPRRDLDWDELPIEIPDKLRDLPDIDRPLLAGVSGQGASALNAHVVLRQADPVSGRQPTGLSRMLRHFPGRAQQPAEDDGAQYLLVLSARSPEALEALRLAYLEYLGPDGPGGEHTARDICYSAATRRQHLEHRLVVMGGTHEELVTALEDPDTPAANPALAVIANRFRNGQRVNWDVVFGDECRYVPLPTYRWQTRGYWPGRAEDEAAADAELTDQILHQHARTEFQSESRLADIGIDSLAKLKLMVELQKKTGLDVDPEKLDKVHTVGELRQWTRELEAAARHE
ncbi:type I polyketide synthase [Stackebrandtia nassauensis]|uniref:Beta-ketoacyl synthase n=1 Tax=Stackebrandtia nassauensis (strain DSM 44728 / CIP 108903 / NRRL B-16338 / NBRC 102104 / LLR-40K-21) TaxID=446470 RepID=D3QB45_STANL|nr:type I polyketide synthase [Stackebrandtia nassauensis]ADD40862.1 Beta-ketoacyl synthase [Stackebrandtia nassauensis DSM 44728]